MPVYPDALRVANKFAQTGPRSSTEFFRLDAGLTTADGFSQHLVRLSGSVDVTIKGMSLQADEVDIHFDTGDFEPRGNVHLKPVTAQ
jgi:lipopolysaccharide assembly outer membrane protein LptD (OstA)